MAQWWILAVACGLLTVLQIGWAGYQLGVGNQSIQIPFLLRHHDPSLYSADAMVNLTHSQYPSLFYRMLSVFLVLADVPVLYLITHLVIATTVLFGFTAIAQNMFGNRWAGFVAILFVLGGHHRALAEQVLYSTGMTHTWAVFPLTLIAIALLFAERHFAAFAVAGLIFNFHALESAQLGFAFGLWALFSYRELKWKKFLLLMATFAVAALPVAVMILLNRQHFDAEWMKLMQVRSGHHSFPFTWWRAGQPDIPRMTIVIALAALAISVIGRGRYLRTMLILALGIAVLFTIGTVFTEVYPSATVVRAQMFRCSRWALALAMIVIAMGCVRGWTLPFQPSQTLPGWKRWLEFLAAILTASCFIVSTFTVLLPVALVVTLTVALINHRLSWLQAMMAGIAILVSLVAWRKIDFVLPALSSEVTWESLSHWVKPTGMGWVMLIAAGALFGVAGLRLSKRARYGLAAAGTLVFAGTVAAHFPQWLRDSLGDAAWVDVQQWVRDHTDPGALVLTPTQPGGFRIHSRRSVVCEWRDGTQLFFSADYAKPWWDRVMALQPGIRIVPGENRLAAQGSGLSQLTDKQVLTIAEKFGATHVVVSAHEPRRLTELYRNDHWAVYLPVVAPRAVVGANEILRQQMQFLDDVVVPNIERNRRSRVTAVVLDPTGRPAFDTHYEIVMKRGSVLFGSASPVTVSNFFQYAVLQGDSWWSRIEPVRGQDLTDAINKRIAECEAAGLEMEWSSVVGRVPSWIHALPAAERDQVLLAHVDKLISRYGSRVGYWQITDQGENWDLAEPLFPKFRSELPQAKLGISVAGRFHSEFESPAREADMIRGIETFRFLKSRGQALDFISIHGKQPWGVWADPRTIYQVLDAYAHEGVRVHITEFSAPSEGWIEGRGPDGEWNEQRQMEYCRMFYMTCFSHPAVDVISYGEPGPVTRSPGAGLLRADGSRKPAWSVLEELITKTWRTTASGEVPIDGKVSWHGYHGEYELAVSNKLGKVARTTFTVGPGTAQTISFSFDAEKGTLTGNP